MTSGRAIYMGKYTQQLTVCRRIYRISTASEEIVIIPMSTSMVVPAS
jgi:hypothetical protein